MILKREYTTSFPACPPLGPSFRMPLGIPLRVPAVLLLRLPVGVLLCLLACSCGFDRFSAVGPVSGLSESGIYPNAYLETLYDGRYDSGQTIEEDFVFEGYVTANDRSGNFFDSLIIQDTSGAVVLSTGFGGLHNIYPEGRRVIVRARGLAAMRTEGVIEIGLHINPHSTYRVEPFGSRTIMEQYVLRDTIVRPPVPDIVRIADLRDSLCGMLVGIGELMPDDGQADLSWACADSEDGNNGVETNNGDGNGVENRGTPSYSEGIRYFCDASGGKIAVVTSGYADFAGEVIPAAELSLTGIVFRGNFGPAREEMFALRLRSIDDVVLR